MLKSTHRRYSATAGVVVFAFVMGLVWPVAFVIYAVVLFLVGLATVGAAVYDWTQRGDEDLEIDRSRQSRERGLIS